MKKLKLCASLNEGTCFEEDAKEQALRISIADINFREHGLVQFQCSSGALVKEYPVLALCVRLSRTDMQYCFTLWRTTVSEERSDHMRGVRMLNSWMDFPKLKTQYEPTNEWQLVLIDMKDCVHPHFAGAWTKLLLGLLTAGNLSVGDCVWMKWAGLFTCRETAEQYFQNGIWFENPTPFFWHSSALVMCDRSDGYPILPERSAADEAARIRNDEMLFYGKLPAEHVVVGPFDPDWGYVHHAGLAWFKGRLYATWSSGKTDEDVPAQRILMSSSDDFFHWTEPVELGTPKQGVCAETCLQNGFMFATDDELFAVYREYDFGPSMFCEDGTMDPTRPWELANCHDYYRSTRDGITWSEVQPSPVSANEAPRKTASGRFVGGCGDAVIFADEPNGHNWLVSNQKPENIQAAYEAGAVLLTEASWFQTDDKVIHLMQRSQMGYLWHCASYDNGNSWSENHRTNFVSDHTMPNFGRLPDGRFYFIGDPYFSNYSRYPMMLCLSEDGYNFTAAYMLCDEPYVMQKDGWAKGGYFAYPEVVIHDDYLYVFYSKHKEVMEITRVKLDDIL